MLYLTIYLIYDILQYNTMSYNTMQCNRDATFTLAFSYKQAQFWNTCILYINLIWQHQKLCNILHDATNPNYHQFSDLPQLLQSVYQHQSDKLHSQKEYQNPYAQASTKTSV